MKSTFKVLFYFIGKRIFPLRRGARVVEEARLESVYTPKGYHEFESRSLRMFIIFLITKTAVLICQESRFFVLYRDTGKINLSLAGTLGK